MQLLSEEDLLQHFIANNKTLNRVMNATDFLAEEIPFRPDLKGCLILPSLLLSVSLAG